mgnify:CR=1 FL=1
MESLVSFVDYLLPFLKGKANIMFESYRQQFHRQPGQEIETGGKSSLVLLWDIFLFVMIAYFVVSIVNSSVKEHLAKVHETEFEQLKQELSSKRKHK